MKYKNLIWTNHAIQRLSDRRIPQHVINDTITNYDFVSPRDDGASEYRKRFDNQTMFAIVKTNEYGEGIIVSCWVNPPNQGTQDFKKRARYLKKQTASPFKKLWLTFLDQIGL